MGKPKRLYDNFIDPDTYRIDELVRLAKSAGLYRGGSPSKRLSILLHNPAIFDEFYREVISTVSDYPYHRFIEHANKAYNDIYMYILNEACPHPSDDIPGWVTDVFVCVEWYPVRTYLGDMPKAPYSEILRGCKMSLESTVGYTIKCGGKARNIIGQVIANIVAIVMGKVYDDLRNRPKVADGKLVAFPNIPVKVLWDSCSSMSPTVMTNWDLDFAIRALRILSCYGVDVNVSQLVWLSSTASLLHQSGEFEDNSGGDEGGTCDESVAEDEEIMDED